jgi:hypothetical protein
VFKIKRGKTDRAGQLNDWSCLKKANLLQAFSHPTSFYTDSTAEELQVSQNRKYVLADFLTIFDEWTSTR